MKQKALRYERGSQWNSFFLSLQSTSLYSKGFFVKHKKGDVCSVEYSAEKFAIHEVHK